MLVKQPPLTRVPVEVFDTAKLDGTTCPVPSCRRPVAVHTYYIVGSRGAVACSETAPTA